MTRSGWIALFIAAAVFAHAWPLAAGDEDKAGRGAVSAEQDEAGEGAGPEEEELDWRRYQSELGFFGGSYLGDAWYNNWDAGARYYFSLNKTWGIGVEYQYNPIRADGSGDFGRGLATNHSHTIFGAIAISNDAALSAGRSVIDCDLYLTLGGGSIMINRQWQWLAVIGGGLKVYTPVRWLAVRFDVNSYLHPTPNPGGSSFNADMAVNAGLSFMARPGRRGRAGTEKNPQKLSSTETVSQSR